MATVPYFQIDNAPLARLPISLSGTEINTTPDLPAAVKLDGVKEAHYAAAPNQVIVPGLPITLYLRPEPSANENDEADEQPNSRLPKRLRARANSSRRGNLKLAHTQPRPTISVATRFVQKQIQYVAERKIIELLPTPAHQPLPAKSENVPQPRPDSHRVNAKNMDAPQQQHPTPEEIYLEQQAAARRTKRLLLDLWLAA